MKKIFLSIAIFAIGIVSATAQNPLMEKLPNDPAVRVGKLDNGLTYYIRHNAKPAGRAEFYLATNVGAIQEAEDQDGLAHFLEHMCFNGTKNFPGKGITDYLQSIGASFGGNVNAQTGVEETVYMLTNIPLIRPSVADTCLLILHDYSHFVLNEDKEIDAERPVIIEERRARRNAQWRMHEQSLPLIFGNSKYGSCTLIGLQESLENFKYESLRNFYTTWYHPDMQAVVVVGDINVDEIEEKIKKIFADIPKAASPTIKEEFKIPDNKEPIIGILTDSEATGSTVEVIWKRPALPEDLNSTLLGEFVGFTRYIVGSVINERLKDIASKPNAPFLSAGLWFGDLCETCDATTANIAFKEGEAIPAFKAAYTEILRMAQHGCTVDEIRRVKENLLSGYESAMHSADTRNNSSFVWPLINNFFDNNSFMDPKEEYEMVKNLFTLITPQIINQFTPTIVSDTNMVVIYKGPKKEGLVNPTKEEFLNAIKQVQSLQIDAPTESVVATELLNASKLKGAKIVKESTGIYNSTVWVLSNGLKVIMLPTDYNKNSISFNLFKEGGYSLVPTNETFNVNDFLVGAYLGNTGLAGFSAIDLPKVLTGTNATASPYISGLTHGISGGATPKDLEIALQLMYLYFTNPRFDVEEFQTGIDAMKAMLPNMVNQPNYKLMQAYYNIVFANNPRHHTLSQEMLDKADIKHIEKCYKQLFNGVNGAEVVIVGDFKIDDIKPLVLKYFGSLPKGKGVSKWIDWKETSPQGEIVKDFTEDMKTPQTTVIELYSAPMKHSIQKVVALSALSYIMDMRYVTSLREEEGGTYGASTDASISREPKQEAKFTIQFQCNPDKADKLRTLAFDDLQKMATSGPTEEEFKMAVENLLKGIPESRITNGYWLNNIISYERHKLDIDKAFEEAVKALKPQDIQKVLQDILASNNHIEIIMRPQNSTETE